MAQFVQLQENRQAFNDAGIAIVGFTYDAPHLQQKFVDKKGIEYPFLSDIDAYTMNTLGILDKTYPPGDENYGIPHPGIFILNPDLKIVGKIFVDGYQKRVNAQAVLAEAIKLLN